MAYRGGPRRSGNSRRGRNPYDQMHQNGYEDFSMHHPPPLMGISPGLIYQPSTYQLNSSYGYNTSHNNEAQYNYDFLIRSSSNSQDVPASGQMRPLFSTPYTNDQRDYGANNMPMNYPSDVRQDFRYNEGISQNKITRSARDGNRNGSARDRSSDRVSRDQYSTGRPRSKAFPCDRSESPHSVASVSSKHSNRGRMRGGLRGSNANRGAINRGARQSSRPNDSVVRNKSPNSLISGQVRGRGHNARRGTKNRGAGQRGRPNPSNEQRRSPDSLISTSSVPINRDQVRGRGQNARRGNGCGSRGSRQTTKQNLPYEQNRTPDILSSTSSVSVKRRQIRGRDRSSNGRHLSSKESLDRAGGKSSCKSDKFDQLSRDGSTKSFKSNKSSYCRKVPSTPEESVSSHTRVLEWMKSFFTIEYGNMGAEKDKNEPSTETSNRNRERRRRQRERQKEKRSSAVSVNHDEGRISADASDDDECVHENLNVITDTSNCYEITSAGYSNQNFTVVDIKIIFDKILQRFNGKIKLRELTEEIPEYFKNYNHSVVLDWLTKDTTVKDWFRVFENECVDGESVIITFRKPLKLCFNYMMTKSCVKTECQYIHMCIDRLADVCTRRNCRFNHEPWDTHNTSILEKLGLNSYSSTEVLTLIRATSIETCAQYNIDGKCTDFDLGSCPDLHICQNYIRNKCDEKDCKLGHDLLADICTKTLKIYELDHLDPSTVKKKVLVLTAVRTSDYYDKSSKGGDSTNCSDKVRSLQGKQVSKYKRMRRPKSKITHESKVEKEDKTDEVISCPIISELPIESNTTSSDDIITNKNIIIDSPRESENMNYDTSVNKLESSKLKYLEERICVYVRHESLLPDYQGQQKSDNSLPDYQANQKDDICFLPDNQAEQKLDIAFRNTSITPSRNDNEPYAGSKIDEVSVFLQFLKQYNGKTCVSTIQKECTELFDSMNALEILEWFKLHKPAKDMFQLFQNKTSPEQSVVIVLIKQLKMCFAYLQTCKKQRCPCLHICKEYVSGTCIKQAENCRYSHNVYGPHNAAILKKYLMKFKVYDKLNEKCLLDLINCSRLKLCTDYISSEEAYCPNWRNKSCPDFHVCERYVRGRCLLSSDKCIYGHNLKTPKHIQTLQLYRMDMLSPAMIKAISFVPNINSANWLLLHPGSSISQTNIRDTDSEIPICELDLRGQCHEGNDCENHHYIRPYLWQIYRKNRWIGLDLDESFMKIEEKFCDVENDVIVMDISDPTRVPLQQRLLVTVDFTNMIWKSAEDNDEEGPIRRLSTKSYVKNNGGGSSSTRTLHTRWRWYWKDDYGCWHTYKSDQAPFQDVLEAKYIHGDKSAYFEIGKNTYVLDFRTMVQTNIKYNTPRQVKRRPVFAGNMTMKRFTFKDDPARQLQFVAQDFPDAWSPMDTVTPDACDKVELEDSNKAYINTRQEFYMTMDRSKYTITQIFRVQNLSRWKAYLRQKSCMEEKNGSLPPGEKKLFHGTDNKITVDCILHQSFDPRMHGKNATMFGRGAYFARDASYSDSYTGQEEHKFMFFAKVLIGKTIKGDSSMQRPPPVDPSKPHGDLYDTCVNNTTDPSIFVVFKSEQCYPEYLICYTKRDNPVTTSSVPPSTTYSFSSSASAYTSNVPPMTTNSTSRSARAYTSSNTTSPRVGSPTGSTRSTNSSGSSSSNRNNQGTSGPKNESKCVIS